MKHERRLRLFIYARILVTFLFLASTVVLNLQDPKAMDELSYFGIVRLMAFSFVFSIVSHVALRVRRYHQFLTYLQTIWDLLFVTMLLLLTGAVTSPYSFLYLLSIMNAGVLLGRREALYTASLCSILYGAMIDLQYFGFLAPLGLSRAAAVQYGLLPIFYTIFLNMIGFYLAAVITGYLFESARQSEDALLEKTVNYDELELLSSTIIANMASGLLTITSLGHVRAFNRYAEEISHRTREEIYDAPLVNVFPALAHVAVNPGRAFSGEFTFSRGMNDKLILGYNTVPFKDTRGELAGAIVNFKDLTELKQMEENLKRADRLAAVGELSARMAHEIRNPLAAMCGSVQLLAEHGSIVESDQRLLTIILREADRLNLLITEFLAYARPALPRKEAVLLYELVEDTRMLILSDQRFSGIEVANQVPSDITLLADAHQLRQVMINLLHNAADALTSGGRIVVTAHRQSLINTQAASSATQSGVVITVTDNGAGFDSDAGEHLFEPFWTSKNDGTGLGLAITYRIIESHGGTISADSLPEGGSRFTIVLPV